MTMATDTAIELIRLNSLRAQNILDTPIENRFERVTRLVQNVLKVPIASFNLVDQNRQWSKSVQGLSLIEIARNQSFCSCVIQGDEIMVVPDARKDDRFATNALVTGNPNIVFYAGYPVHAPDGQKIGALCAIDRQPRELSHKEEQVLRDLAGVLESELKLADLSNRVAGLNDKLQASQQLAMIDPLTRLWNRAGLIKILDRDWNEAIRNDDVLSVLIADIDHFSNFNAEHGREFGDLMLKDLAKILMAELGSEDSIGRLDADQFMIILPRSLDRKAYKIAERMRIEAQTSISEASGGHRIPLTISFGGACLIPSAKRQMTDLMKVADDAMVQAKKSGRNQTVVLNGENSVEAA